MPFQIVHAFHCGIRSLLLVICSIPLFARSLVFDICACRFFVRLLLYHTNEFRIGANKGIFSDIALKTNIKPVGKLPNGLSLYTWDWTEEAQEIVGNQPSYGVIAQEVQQVIPEAVMRQNDGYLAVDYSKIL